MRAKIMQEIIKFATLIGSGEIYYKEGVFCLHNMQDTIVRVTTSLDAPEFLVGTQDMKKVVRRFKAADEITLGVQGDYVSILRGSTTYRILSKAIYPVEYSWGNYPVSASGDAQMLVKNVIPMMSSDVGRPHLNGVLLSVDEDGVRLCATDGHRLAFPRMPAKSFQGSAEGILPPNTLKILQHMSGDITFAMGDRHAYFYEGAIQIDCRLVDARFPPWDKVVPNDKKDPWVFDVIAPREKLLDAIKTTNLEGKKTKITFQKRSLVLSQDEDGIVASSEVLCEGSHELDEDYYVDPKYLLDAVTHTRRDDVRLRGHGPTDAILVGNDNVVMPRRR